MATIDDLNEYCLIEIFSHVDFRERQRLELVCKRWRQINQIFWQSMRKFEYSIIGSEYPYSLLCIRHGLKLECSDVSHFGKILIKFNCNLEKLAIITNVECEQPLDIPSWIFKVIIKNENLNSVEIDVHNEPIYTECLKLLKADNLQHLRLFCHLKLTNSKSVLDAVKKLLKNAPQLETLYLCNVRISIHKINKITTLKSLSIDMSKLHVRPLIQFNFINIESIELTLCEDVNDNFIKHLVKNCTKLCAVEIFDCGSITVKGLIPITTLSELRHFGASEINDEVLDKLSNLETFSCCMLDLHQSTMKNTIFNFFQRSSNLKTANVDINGDSYLFDKYAREFGIELNVNKGYRIPCFCDTNWEKQFYN